MLGLALSRRRSRVGVRLGLVSESALELVGVGSALGWGLVSGVGVGVGAGVGLELELESGWGGVWVSCRPVGAGSSNLSIVPSCPL